MSGNHVLRHAGDLESARLSRDHAARLRRTVADLRPLGAAFQRAEGKAYDPAGTIPALRDTLQQWIACHEETAEDLDRVANAYEANASSSPDRALHRRSPLALALGETAHNVILALGIFALCLIGYRALQAGWAALHPSAAAVERPATPEVSDGPR
jgi:hypothetical protein